MIRENRGKFAGKPSLQVELGNSMQAVGVDRGVKNKWLWQGMQQLGIDVYNIGEDDVVELKALGVDITKSERFISANLLSVKTGEPLAKPYLVKELALPGIPKRFRIGFLGLTARESFLKTEEAGYVWADPLSAAKKWVPQVKANCDLVVVLACMPTKNAVQLAVDNSDISVVLNGFKHQPAWPQVVMNKATIAYAEDEAKILSELRFAVSPDGNVQAKPVNYVLTRNVADEPEMAKLIQKAKTEIAQIQLEIAKGSGSSAPQLPVVQEVTFATAQQCASCHPAAFETWSKSKHSQAIEILQKQNKQFDTACVVCHVTGVNQAGGFLDMNRTPHLANVQCEACHGSGRQHSQKPVEAKMAKLSAPAVCVGCHTKSNSPDFDFASYWPKVQH